MSYSKDPKSGIPDFIVNAIGSHFLEGARYLREIQDEAPDAFIYVVEQLGIGRRKAYALAKIDRSFHCLGVPRDRLRKIGWTKLSLLAPYVTGNNVDKLLKLAEETTAHELKLIMQGREVDPDGKVIVLYLRVEELTVFDQVLQAYGATKHARGWLGKEAAIIKALREAIAEPQ